MKCYWENNPNDKLESAIRLCNVMFPLYLRYCRDRGTNLTSVEYTRNIVPILLSGIIDYETIKFCELEIEAIERDLKIENSILNKIFK